MNRRPGEVGLNFRTAIEPTPPVRKRRWSVPAAIVTTAFFQPGREPTCMPRRFGLAGILITLTSSTSTENSFSTACRICVLWASGWTRNVYLPRSAIMP